MSWITRLRSDIEMKSPKGSTFNPLWKGDAFSFEKKIGAFSPPDFKGSILQDLNIRAQAFPLTVFFTGSSYDLQGKRFMKALKEVGNWEIIHPTQGFLRLLLARVTYNDFPVESGNVVQVDTEWLEPANVTAGLSLLQIAAGIENIINTVNAVAEGQFEEVILLNTPALSALLGVEANIIGNIASVDFENLFRLDPKVSAVFESTKRGITNTLSASTIDPCTLAAQFQTLIQTPLEASTNITGRLDTYTAFVGNIISRFPTGDTDDQKNNVVLHEMILTAAIGGLAKIIITGNLQSRGQVIESVENLRANYNNISENLDIGQSRFQVRDLDEQYFSQSQTFNDATNLVYQSIDYLLKASLDLAIEKRFTLKHPRSPMEIAFTEYGTLGPNQENLDLFIDSNKLTGDEILLLPAGKEVLVYVV